MSITWKNWSRSVRCRAREVLYPSSEERLFEMVGEARREGRRLKAVGAGHSFSPLVKTGDSLVSLDRCQGILELAADRSEVTVWGGTRLHRLTRLLAEEGLALENLGDIDRQSVSGALATGTHGTGIGHGCLSTQVTGLTLVTGRGEVVECSEEKDCDLFKAAQVSLGVLGIISRVRLRLRPAFWIHEVTRRVPFADLVDHLSDFTARHDHFEFFWFPYSDSILVKALNPTQEATRSSRLLRFLNDTVLHNWAFHLICLAARARPSLAGGLSKFTAAVVSGGEKVDAGHRVFASPRRVKFQEMEYAVDARRGLAAFGEIREMLERQRIPVNFPIEVRFVKGDDIWLSPFYQRDSVTISLHMFKGMEYREFFRQCETTFHKYDGRPHWGKMHSLQAPQLEPLYPKWKDFQAVRRQCDPDGIFLTDYLRALLMGV